MALGRRRTRRVQHRRANRILDEAGYERGNGVRPCRYGDHRLPLLPPRRQHRLRQRVQFASEWWERIGLEIAERADRTGFAERPGLPRRVRPRVLRLGRRPRPDRTLAATCAVLPVTADGSERSHENFYCNEEYDDLHERQKVEPDPDARAELVEQQQRLLYHDAPAIWLYYQNVLEAYDHSSVDGFRTQPSDGGMITGQQGFLWSYLSAVPVKGGDEDGVATGVLVAVGAAVLVLIAGGVLLFMRRRSTADERE